MGSFFSKPAPVAPKFAPDLSRGTFTADELTRQLADAQRKASEAVTGAVATTSSAISGFYKPIVWILGLAVFVVICIVIYDFTAPDNWPNIFFSKRRTPAPGGNDAAKPPVGSPPPAPPPPTVAQSLYSGLTGGSSGDLTSNHDATVAATIPGNQAPLSGPPLLKENFTDVKGGAYGMQWWMFVKDWNYGFGKEKIILQRPDVANSAIMNPKITLHPTDNTMQISVSIFPSTEGGSSKAQPAPAGHSASADDVFVCSVPNIPLQTWFSVSVTSFGRNLDIYIDGKLVKSCFLTGVPKPCLGDIQVTPNGGFSGQMCGLNHYAKMLVPSDAMAFWSAGTPCRSSTAPTTAESATGYSVKFGMYDALGKKVREFSF